MKKIYTHNRINQWRLPPPEIGTVFLCYKIMERDFKGVWIPRELYLNEDLSWAEKILLVEVDSLDKDGTGCFAGNEFLAKFLMMSEGSVANMIVKLINKGYIIKKGFDGRKRYISVNSELTNLLVQTSQKSQSSFNKNMNSESIKKLKQTKQKCEHTNTVSKTTNNTIKKEYVDLKKSTRHTPEKKSKVEKILYTLPDDFSTDLKETFEAFMLYKKERKESYKSEHSINLLIKKIQANRVHFSDTLIVEVINMSMENNWAGIFFDKLQKNKEEKKQNNKFTYTGIPLPKFKIIGE